MDPTVGFFISHANVPGFLGSWVLGFQGSWPAIVDAV